MDDAIGEVLDLLDQYGLTENTIVIFFSDNGGSGGSDNHPLRGGKSQMFEGGIRVPCIVRFPGRIPEGSTNDELLTALEVMPTLLKLADVEVPDDLKLDGHDMLATLAGKSGSPRKEMFWQRREDKAARVGHWKWVESARGGGLFDLTSDVGESRDLSQERPEKLAELKQRFSRWEKLMRAADSRGPFRDY
jgi:arylsulfatase A-like enzyme